MKFSIHGSIISMDIFHQLEKEEEVEWYRARSSLHSLNKEPLEEDPGFILSPEIQRKCVIDDLTKRPLELDNSDFLIIDFIDERFDVVNFHNTVSTCSNEFKNAFEPPFDQLFPRGSDEDFIEWRGACKRFAEHTMGAPIILHRSKFASLSIERGKGEFGDSGSSKTIDQMNHRFRRYEDIFCQEVDVFGIIEVDESLVISDSGSPWGIAPYHFINEYYIEAYRQLLEITSSKKNNISKNSETQQISHEIVTYFGIGILDENWLHHRINLFKFTLFESLSNQTSQNFQLNLYIDFQHPEFVKLRLESILQGSGFEWCISEVDSIESADKNGGSVMFQQEYAPSETKILISAIDDDDFIHQSAIEEMQSISESEEGYALFTLNVGLEIDIERRITRIIKPESIKLLLSLLTPPGEKIFSPVNFNHVSIQKTLEKKINAKHHAFSNKIWFAHVKHSLSDSAYYGSRYRISNDPNSFLILEDTYLTNSLGISSIKNIQRLGTSLPDGMPYKPLSRGNDLVRYSTDDFRTRMRMNNLTRKKISFQSPVNILVIGNKVTFRIIEDSLGNVSDSIEKYTDGAPLLSKQFWDVANPDIVFFDLPSIYRLTGDDLENLEQICFDLFLRCQHIFVHLVPQEIFDHQPNDVVTLLEKMQVPVEVIGRPDIITNEEEYHSYLSYFVRMLENRFNLE